MTLRNGPRRWSRRDNPSVPAGPVPTEYSSGIWEYPERPLEDADEIGGKSREYGITTRILMKLPAAGFVFLHGTAFRRRERKDEMHYTDYRLLERGLREVADNHGLKGNPYERRTPILTYRQEMLCLNLLFELPEGCQRLDPKLARRMVRSLVYTSFQGERAR